MLYRRCCVICEICLRNRCHPRCPNYITQKTLSCCSLCGEEIQNGEEYIENDNGDVAHCDCFYDIKECLEWLGYEINTMENDYE